MSKVIAYYVSADHGQRSGDGWVEKRVDLGKFFTEKDAEDFRETLVGKHPLLLVDQRLEEEHSQHPAHHPKVVTRTLP